MLSHDFTDMFPARRVTDVGISQIDIFAFADSGVEELSQFLDLLGKASDWALGPPQAIELGAVVLLMAGACRTMFPIITVCSAVFGSRT